MKIKSKLRFYSLLWLIAILSFAPQKVMSIESVAFETPDVVAQNLWSFGGTLQTGTSANLTISIFLDGSSSAASIVGYVPNAVNWAASVDLSTLSVGPHSALVKVTPSASPSTSLSTATQFFSINRFSPRIYVPLAFAGFNYSANYFSDETSCLFIPALSDVQIMPNAILLPNTVNHRRATIFLSNRLDSGESLGLTAGLLPVALAASPVYNSTTGILSIDAANLTIGASYSDFQTAISKVIYLNPGSPTAGLRNASVYLTDLNDAVSNAAVSRITVGKGVPLVSYSGSYALPNVTISVPQSTGSVLLCPNGAVDVQTPNYVSGNMTPYNPPKIYQSSGTNNVREYGGQIVDNIEVTLLNPNGPLLPTEYLSIQTPPEFSYYGSNLGNQLMWDGSSFTGSFPVLNYPMYSAALVSVSTSSNNIIYSIKLSQRVDQVIPLPTPGPRPMSVEVALTALKSLRYTNSSQNPTSAGITRFVDVRVNSATSMPGNLTTNYSTISPRCTLTIIPTNTSPTVTAPAPLSVDQSSALVPTAVAVNGFIITDPDGNNYGATGALINNPEALAVRASNGTVTYSGSLTNVSVASGNGTATLVLRGPVNGSSGTLTQVFTGGLITYRPDVNFSGTDTIQVTLNDNGNSSINQSPGSPLALSATASASVTVAKINQPAVISAPAARATTSGVNHIITSIFQSDPDVPAASSSPLQLTIQATRGTVSLAGITGLSFSFSDVDGTNAGTGTNDTQITCRGTPANVAVALTELTYKSNANYYGAGTITLSVNDLGSTGTRRASYIGGSIAAGGSANSLITSATIAMGIGYVNAPPSVTSNVALSVPIGAALTVTGGTHVAPTNYPPAVTRLPNSYAVPTPGNAGTTATGTSNLVAQDVETKQASGLTYTINLPVTQGSLQRSRPSMPVVSLIAGSTFTQNDLNNGYVTYTHNGALSGDDGFVFTVTDDNATTAPASAPGGQVNGATSQQIYNFVIDRTKPIAIFNGSTTPVYTEGTAPLLIDNNPLTRVINATDTTNFVLVGSTGQLTATVTIPTQLGVNPGTISSDSQDTLTLLDQAPLGFTGQQMFYNGSPIGSYSGGNGTPLVVTLSSALPVSVAAVSETLRHLQFSNPGANLSASNRLITVTVLNGAGQTSVAVSKTVQVVPVNNAPVITPPTQALVTVPGLTVGGLVQSTDPDGVLSFALTGSPPTRGLVTVDAVSGAFTYSPAPNPNGAGGVLTDQFEVTASDPGIPANTTVKTTSQIYQVRVCDLGSVAPVFTTNPPLETVLGRVLTYAPQVSTTGLTAPNLTYSLLGLSPGVNPGLGFNSATGTITWPAGWSVSPVPTADSYQRLGLLVVDQANQVAAYQPIMLKILLVPHTSN